MAIETLLIGLVVAVLYVEITGIHPGGIIVPGYMALYLDQPLRVLATLCVALLSLLSYRILSRYLILFGRRRFAVFILLGGILAEGWLLFLPRLFASPIELRVIGLVIPGLLANNLQKQRPLPTLASLGTASIVTYFLAKLATLL